MRVRSLLDIAQIWRWRRIRRHGVVLASRHHPAPDGIAYTWTGRRVGNATRGQLADALTAATRRHQRVVATEWNRPTPGNYGGHQVVPHPPMSTSSRPPEPPPRQL